MNLVRESTSEFLLNGGRQHEKQIYEAQDAQDSVEEAEQNIHSGDYRDSGLDSIYKHNGNFPVLLYRDGMRAEGQHGLRRRVSDSSSGDTCKTVDSRNDTERDEGV